MKQKYIFLESEGDAWFERNHEKPFVDDVPHCITGWIGTLPRRVLEIGCGAGQTLASLRDLYGCDVMGVEPSRKAAMAAAGLRVPVMQSTASSLPVAGPFDLIIYGFCLYLTDPDDWLLIAAEGDRVLANRGYIIIRDFGDTQKPYGVPYEHDRRITSWHYDWANLWLGHPAYELIHRQSADGYATTILRKNEMKP